MRSDEAHRRRVVSTNGSPNPPLGISESTGSRPIYSGAHRPQEKLPMSHHHMTRQGVVPTLNDVYRPPAAPGRGAARPRSGSQGRARAARHRGESSPARIRRSSPDHAMRRREAMIRHAPSRTAARLPCIATMDCGTLRTPAARLAEVPALLALQLQVARRASSLSARPALQPAHRVEE